MVLVLEPIVPNKTSPTYDDMFLFIEKLLEVEQWNDDHLARHPQLPTKLERLKRLVSKFDSRGKEDEMREIG